MLRTGVVVLALLVWGGEAAVTLEELSDVYLPIEYNPTAVYQYNSDSATCGAHDVQELLYYVGGSNIISVYDISRINNIGAPEYTRTLISGVIADIELCGNFLAVAKDNTNSPADGQVVIFRKYSALSNTMEKLHEISVGTNPRDIDFTSDCQKIVVAVEGTLVNSDGTVYDPEGMVAVISWQDDDLSEPYNIQFADFRSFNSRAAEYVARGVRWVYRGQGSGIVNTFSQDMEPESIELDLEEEKAYVVLQENNAIAVMDVANATIEEILPLGTKDFSEDGLDPSDRDGGINIAPWPLRGMYQPSRASKTQINGEWYLTLVNEGMERQFSQPDYPFSWRESKTGQEIVAEGLLAGSVSESVRAMLQDDQQLGRTRISTIDGLSANGSGIETLHVYGGRSFSMYFLSNLSLAYESGNSIETVISTSTPTVFNADPEQATQTPVESYDLRSTFQGPQPDALESATVDGTKVVIVGTGRPGQIIVYSIPTSGPIVPHLESVYYQGGSGSSWQGLYNAGTARSLGIEQLEIIQANDSPNLDPLLVVIGRITGTAVFFRIRVTRDSTWQRIIGMVKGVPSSITAFGKSIVPGSPQGGLVQPVAVAAICLSVIALTVGAVLLVVTVKNQRRMRKKNAIVSAATENGIPMQ